MAHLFLLRAALSATLVTVMLPVLPENPKWLRTMITVSKEEIAKPGNSFNEIYESHEEYRNPDWPNARWYDYLPPCPDREADINKADWVKEDPALSNWFHPGAISYRSRRYYASPDGVKGLCMQLHGQQACYRRGILITDSRDPGAASADFAGPSRLANNLEPLGFTPLYLLKKDLKNFKFLKDNEHFQNDVVPFLGRDGQPDQLSRYIAHWPTQKGTHHPFHVLVGSVVKRLIGSEDVDFVTPFVDESHATLAGMDLEREGWRDTVLDVKAGDIVQFEAKGDVKWGYKGEKCGPDGDPKIYTRNFLSFSKPPRTDLPTAALIGAILPPSLGSSAVDLKTIPTFKIGVKRDFAVPKSGRLWLGINDGYVVNNEGFFDVRVTRLTGGSH